MKAYEIPLKVTSDGKIELPLGFVDVLPREKTIRAILLVSEPDDPHEEADWQLLTAEQFLAGYDAADSILVGS